MVSQPSQSTIRHRWHDRIEYCTPNDASGRLLVAILSGSFGVCTLTWSVATFLTSGLLLPLTLLLVGLSLGAIVLSLVMIWPIYLSLVGNVEAAEAYPQADTTSSEESRDSSIAIAKRQYAAGNITEEEFERRVENLLHTDVRSQSRTTQREGSETLKETN